MRPRENPFRVSRLEALEYEIDDGGWEGMIERLEALGWRGAVVGPHGSGKTTLLTRLGPRLAARGFDVRAVRLTEGVRRLAPEQRAVLYREVGPSALLVVDGVDELSRLAWWELRRRSLAAGGLVVASHVAGRLATWHRCEPSVRRLASLVARLHDTCGCELPPIEALFRRHAGNVRHALWELYDHHADRGDGAGSRFRVARGSS